MQVLVWLLIPLAATALGIAWAVWRARERKPMAAEQAMEDLARFREAMERPMPPLRMPEPGDEELDERT